MMYIGMLLTLYSIPSWEHIFSTASEMSMSEFCQWTFQITSSKTFLTSTRAKTLLGSERQIWDCRKEVCGVSVPQTCSLQQPGSSTELRLHWGVGGAGRGTHSSLLVWLLHVHMWQLDFHLSPTWDTQTQSFNIHVLYTRTHTLKMPTMHKQW